MPKLAIPGLLKAEGDDDKLTEVELDIPESVTGKLRKYIDQKEEPVVPEGNIIKLQISVGLAEGKIKWKGKGDGAALKEGNGPSVELKNKIVEHVINAWKTRKGGASGRAAAPV